MKNTILKSTKILGSKQVVVNRRTHTNRHTQVVVKAGQGFDNRTQEEVGFKRENTAKAKMEVQTDAGTELEMSRAASESPASVNTSSGGRESCSEKAEVEFCVMNFYHLVDVADQDMELAAHKKYLENKDIKGRIFISHQGINAQISGPLEVTVKYGEWIKQRKAFHDLRYSTFPSPGHAFPKLNVRTKALVSLLREGELPITDPASRATKVSPKEWKAMLEDVRDPDKAADSKPLVIDVRNGYEWDVGHFQGAERPEEINFIDTPTGKEIYGSLDKIEKDTPIMMYCTGGIRCDIYSTVMKKQGFKNLYTLDGGIQNYFRKEGDDHWNGALYVFDSRMAVPTSLDAVKDQDKVQAAIPCELCGNTAEAPHLNCANVDCNKLFLACTACKQKLKGCCCVKCTDAPRLLRPIKVDGYYSKMLTYASDDKESEVPKKQKKIVAE